MSNKKYYCVCILAILCSISFAFIVDGEFANSLEPADSVYSKWKAAGCCAVIDSVFTIDVTETPDSVTYVLDDVDIPIPSAVASDGNDDSFTFNKLVIWMRDNIANQGIHGQIYIPNGTYNFSDQIIMNSNISLKGDGSHLTELRFYIHADSTSTIMTQNDCRKDAILIEGTSSSPNDIITNVGIEDLKITRVKDSFLTENQIWEYTYEKYGGRYLGNNIAIRYAQNCWVKGVESERPFRNHVTMQFSDHISIV